MLRTIEVRGSVSGQPVKRSAVIGFLLQELTEVNYRPHGGNWKNLNDLVDAPSGVYGSLGAWAVCAAIVEDFAFHFSPRSDEFSEVSDYLPVFAAAILGVSRTQWTSIEGLSLKQTRERLERLLDHCRRVEKNS